MESPFLLPLIRTLFPLSGHQLLRSLVWGTAVANSGSSTVYHHRTHLQQVPSPRSFCGSQPSIFSISFEVPHNPVQTLGWDVFHRAPAFLPDRVPRRSEGCAHRRAWLHCRWGENLNHSQRWQPNSWLGNQGRLEGEASP